MAALLSVSLSACWRKSELLCSCDFDDPTGAWIALFPSGASLTLNFLCAELVADAIDSAQGRNLSPPCGFAS
jgi:hypothetical protein